MSGLAEATTKVVEILTTFNTEERLRIVRASLMLLGDELSQGADARRKNTSAQSDDDGDFEGAEFHNLAQQWMRKHAITSAHLEHCFHLDQGKVIPISLPGNATASREMTINAYLTMGLANFLATGDASFSDADARKLCEEMGCYDNSNHSKTVKALKNRVTGSKSNGWKMTAPGLSAVAELVKVPKG